uniref:NTPase protein n=1 Tax=Rousettus bat poxvirus TaxID=3141933 RepID=A0AAU7E286_9POXV
MTKPADNDVIFILKQIGVSASARAAADLRFVESFVCDELSEYIESHPRCTLFESLRDEEACGNVRVFFDVDLPAALDEAVFVPVFKDFIVSLSGFVANFAVSECEVLGGAGKAKLVRCMRSEFSLTRSTNADKTSFHLLFLNLYTTLDTLIAMKKPLLEFIRRSSNMLVRAIDAAVFRRGATLRVVGTRKTRDCAHVHAPTPPHARIEDYLFTYVAFTDACHYFVYRRTAPPGLSRWDGNFISFSDAIKRVCQTLVNEVVNVGELTEDNFTDVPLVIDYITPCALCRKVSHKHPHHIAVANDAIRVFKSGNPHSCRVKVIPLEGNKLFTIAQRILEANVINITERGDHIVWLRNAWHFSSEESIITKLVLLMRDSLDPDCSPQLLCPRNRKVVESNLRDLLIDPVETDIFPEKLPFSNGVLDISDGTFSTGIDAKDFMCTVSTGYKLDENLHARDAVEDARRELEAIIDDIQPRTEENAENRALYEKVLSSCLCGTTKPCIFFFYGDTATGKSTTKRLLASALHGLLVETGQTILTDVLDKGPNPFVANMHLKRAVFCSELPDFSCAGSKKIRADNIKKLTEPCIVGRPCYSNKINNRNHATIIIDTNYRPVFDKVDNALMRRVGLVRFKTHFSNSAVPLSAQYDAVRPLDNTLDRKIQNHRFRFAFLHMLVEWYQKHHLPNLDIPATPDLIPDFRFHRTIGAVVVPSDSTHVKAMSWLAKMGYVLSDDGTVVMPAGLFQQRLAGHFNVRVYGHDIESFVQKHKKFASVSEEYLEYIFLEDLAESAEQ